jgi:hypothetical protein
MRRRLSPSSAPKLHNNRQFTEAARLASRSRWLTRLRQCAAHDDGILMAVFGLCKSGHTRPATGGPLYGDPQCNGGHATSPLAGNRPRRVQGQAHIQYPLSTLHISKGTTIHHPFIQSHPPLHRRAGASHREMTAKPLDQGHISHGPQ